MLPLVLGSSSPARKKLLERLQIPFDVFKPEVDESPLPGETTLQLVKRLAVLKAQTAAKYFPSALIIGCDQMITLDNEVFGKPHNYENAMIQLKKCSGRRVTSYTGLCLFNSLHNRHQLSVERYSVIFRELNENMIANYIEKDHPLHCAGSIKAESLGAALFERMQGRDPSALEGLPLIRLVRMLEREKVTVV